MTKTEGINFLLDYFNGQVYCTETECDNDTCIANVSNIITEEFEYSDKPLALQDLFLDCIYIKGEYDNE